MEKLVGLVTACLADAALFGVGVLCLSIDQNTAGAIALASSGWFAASIAECVCHEVEEPDDETILDAIEDR